MGIVVLLYGDIGVLMYFLAIFEITVGVENITLGEPAKVNVTLPEDATGNVTVTIGNITRTVPVTGGENTILIHDVSVGEYDVTVTTMVMTNIILTLPQQNQQYLR